MPSQQETNITRFINDLTRYPCSVIWVCGCCHDAQQQAKHFSLFTWVLLSFAAMTLQTVMRRNRHSGTEKFRINMFNNVRSQLYCTYHRLVHIMVLDWDPIPFVNDNKAILHRPDRGDRLELVVTQSIESFNSVK